MTEPLRGPFPGPFRGAKVMLFAGPSLVVLRRDDMPGIAWPGYLDFPGGLSEPGETPEDCALRETFEELGLTLDAAALRLVQRVDRGKGEEWFFALHGPVSLLDDVVFGNEGQGWQAMAPEAFVDAEDAIPHFREILRDYLVKS